MSYSYGKKLRTVRTTILNVVTSAVLLGSSLGTAVPLLLSQKAFAATLDVCSTSCTYTSIQSAITAANPGDTITVGGGTYNESELALNKAGLSLVGQAGAKLVVPDSAQVNGFDITANNVTVSGFEIAGPVNVPYTTYNWGGNVSRGITVSNGVTNFTITDNNIHDVRNGVLIDGRNTGNLTDNVIDNTKGAVSVQYTDGSDIAMTGNSQGANGNDWGVNLHLNGHFIGSTAFSNAQKIAADAPAAAQQVILDNSAANNGWTVQDQGYSTSNRTDVNIATTGTATGQGDPLGPINTVQGGLDAVTKNGTVHVANGTYTEQILFGENGTKLVGASQAGVVISPLSNSFGQGVTADGLSDISLQNLTIKATAASGGYGLKVHNASNVTVSNVTITGPSTGLGGADFNGVNGASLSNVSISNFGKNGLSFDTLFANGDQTTKNVSLNNVSSTNNGWNGLAFYTTNNAGTVGGDMTGVSFSGNTTLTGNGQFGLFMEGDTDSHFGASATPQNTITGGAGAPVSLGATAFSGNTLGDIINYQTKDLTATSTTFNSKTGTQMTTAERNTEDGHIIDKLDHNAYGLVSYFTPDTTPPSVPVNGLPNNSFKQTNDFLFTWDASTDDSTGPITYEFQSSASSNVDSNGSLVGAWNSIANGNSEQNNLTSPQIHSTGASDGHYFWQVRAIDAAGNKSAWSQTWNMTIDSHAPTGLANLSPTDGTHGTTAGLTVINWHAADDANGPVTYYYEAAAGSDATTSDGSFVSPVYGPASTGSNTFINTPNTPAGTYFWHVKAVDAAGNSTAWTSPWEIVVDNSAPAATFTFPTPGPAATSFQVHFNEAVKVSEVTDPANYRLNNWPGASSFASLAGHATVSYNASTHVATVTFTDPAWYVSAEQQWGVQNIHDLAGNEISPDPTTDYSSPLVVPNAPGTPTATSAGNDATITWNWSAATDPGGADASGVKGYLYELTDSANNVIVPYTSTSTLGATTPVSGDGTYTLHVKAVDNAGNVSSETTGSTSIDATAPAVPANLHFTADSTHANIPDGSTTNAFAVTAGWDGVADADHYQYKIWTNIPSSSNNSEATASIIDVYGISQSGTFNEGDGTHFIEIRAVDATGNVSNWSAPFTVTYDSTAPIVTVSDESTSDTTPTVAGTVNDATANVIVAINGNTYTATVDSIANTAGSFDWSADITDSLAVGDHTATITATDPAGNTSTATATLTITAAPITPTFRPVSIQVTNAVQQVALTGPATNTGNTNGAGTGTGNTTQQAVLGASTDKANTDSGSTGKVKGANVVNLANADNKGSFLALGWWWLAILAAAGFFFALAKRRSADDKN